MHEFRLILFRRDKLDYRFCAPKWKLSREAVPLENLLESLSKVDAGLCQRLVFAGGSPLEHPDFEALVERSEEMGFRRLALETDAKGLAAPGKVEWLSSRGFEEIFIVCASNQARSHDIVMRDPGSLEATLEGIRLAAAGAAKIYLVVPVLKANVRDLNGFLDWVLEQKPKVKGFLLSLPEIEQVPEAAYKALLPLRSLVKVIAHIFDRCQRRRLEYGFTVRRGLTPCATRGELDWYGTIFHERVEYFRHNPDLPVARVRGCENCVLTHSCHGVEKSYVDHFGDEEFEGVSLDMAMNWKRRALNKLEKFDYTQFSPYDNDMSLIRVNGHCNMACSFCFVDLTAPDLDYEILVREIEVQKERGIKHLILSGGEPTLHPRLPDLVRKARTLGIHSVEIQSNGVKAANLDYARELAEAGLTLVTVSLHSIDPKKSDEITRLPKAFHKTLQGMHNFREVGVQTQVACVITQLNYTELPEYVRFLREEFPEEKGHLSICFAIAQPISELVSPWVLPRFSEIRPYFRNALDYSLETGVGFGGIIGQGGYPPCMLDGELKYYELLMEKIYRSDDHETQFYKAPRCKECSFDPYCVGVRRQYIDTYGDDEIKPFQVSQIPHQSRDSPVDSRA
jgi:MoaA/NifB/PqqE/SkfB family radical SAM enzyme